jgi:hypothetical protein
MQSRWNLLKNIDCRLTAIEQKLTQIGAHMATQADVDALTTAVDTLVTSLTADDSALQAAVAGIAAEIAALQQQNPALDISALQSSVAGAQAAVTQISTDATSVQALIPPVTG